MTKGFDQKYLREDQYKDQKKLQARIDLHQRFSENPQDYYEWVIEQLSIQQGMTVLDVGCGTGALWKRLAGKMPDNFSITLADLSWGMILQTRSVHSSPRFSAVNLDAQFLPFTSESYDLVIANHMLYHVPDIDKALSEIHRVLIPGGTLIATTNGENHLVEIRTLLHQVSDWSEAFDGQFSHRFSLKNAHEFLENHFVNVTVKEMPGDLFVTEVQPLIDYINSMDYFNSVDAERTAKLEDIIVQEIAAHGGYRIQKSGGITISQKQ